MGAGTGEDVVVDMHKVHGDEDDRRNDELVADNTPGEVDMDNFYGHVIRTLSGAQYQASSHHCAVVWLLAVVVRDGGSHREEASIYLGAVILALEEVAVNKGEVNDFLVVDTGMEAGELIYQPSLSGMDVMEGHYILLLHSLRVPFPLLPFHYLPRVLPVLGRRQSQTKAASCALEVIFHVLPQ